MSMKCTICTHSELHEIDKALLTGQSLQTIARSFGCSKPALFRHKQSHLTKALVKAKQVVEEIRAETLFDRLREINLESRAILEEARRVGSRDNDLALKAIARIEKQLELEGRLLGELDDETKKIAVGININAPSSQYDLSVLSDEELQTVSTLMKKAIIKN